MSTPFNNALELVLKLNSSAFQAGLNTARQSVDRSVSSMRAGMNTLNTAVKGLAGVLAGGLLAGYARRIVDIADQYGQLDAKVRLATASEQEAAAVKKQLFAISQQTGTAYTANADAFAKLGMALKEVGASGSETVRIVDMVNKSLAVNGSDAASAASFQLQFAQAMGSGVLQGDEFRAMLESNGFFAQQLAKQLGTNVAGLREMSSAGELTSDVLRAAFPGMAQAINDAFAKLPVTTDRAKQTLRNTWESIIDEANKSGAATGKIARALLGLNDTLESNRDAIQTFLSSMVSLAARLVELGVGLVQWTAAVPAWVKHVAVGTAGILAFAAAFQALLAGASAVRLAITSLVTVARAMVVPMGALKGNFGAFLVTTGQLSGRIKMLKMALRGLNTVAMAAFAGWEIGKYLEQFPKVQIAAQRFFHSMEEGWLMVKMAWARAFGSDEEVQALGRQIDAVEERYRQAVREIEGQSRQSSDARIADEQKVADAAVSAAEQSKNAHKKALDKMAAQYKRYVDQIRSLQDEIAGRERSLSAELREMGRSGMSESDAWADQKREAEEYAAAAKQAAAEARAALASGDSITANAKFKEAASLADEAKNSYKALNVEVRDGEQVVISKADALKTAMAGVREAGQLGIDILKQEQEAAAAAAKDLEGKYGLEQLTSKMDESEKKWLESWKRMGEAAGEAGKEVEQVYNVWKNASGYWTNTADAFSAGWSRTADKGRVEFDGMWADFEKTGKKAADDVSQALDRATKARTVKIYTQTIEKRALGGLIGAARLARGGKLPGFGGGDRISALLEAGEFVMRKEAVARFGTGFFDALNHLRLPDFSALLPVMPVPALAATAAPGRTMNINLTLGGETWPMQTDEVTAQKIERWYALRSSNRITRSDYHR